LNMSETVTDRGLVPKGPPMTNSLWGIEWSGDQRRLVTPKGQVIAPNTVYFW